IRSLRSGLGDALDPSALSTALSELLGGEVQLVFKRFCEPTAGRDAGHAMHFSMQDDSLGISVVLEPQLADACLSSLLKQASGLAGDRLPAAPAVQGMLSRVLVEAARRMPNPLCVRPVGARAQESQLA